MSMAVDLRIETFQNLVGEGFRLLVPGEAGLDLRLSEVTPLSAATSPPGSPRTPFSLLFHGPLTPWVRQATHHLEHAGLGSLDLFLVPLGPDAAGMRYEAVFT
jgi:hypothetical protein